MEKKTEFFQIKKVTNKDNRKTEIEAMFKPEFRKAGGRNTCIRISRIKPSNPMILEVKLFTKSGLNPLKLRKSWRASNEKKAMDILMEWIKETEVGS